MKSELSIKSVKSQPSFEAKHLDGSKLTGSTPENDYITLVDNDEPFMSVRSMKTKQVI